MGISHVKSNVVADMTGTVTVFNSQGSTTTVAATDLVRPSDWNSIHNWTQNFSGNTAGTSQITGTDLVWAGGSNVTLSANGQTVSINAAGAVIMSYVPFEVQGLASVAIGAGTSSSGNLSLWPVSVNGYVAVDRLNALASVSFLTVGTSSARQTCGFWWGLYTRGNGTQNSTLSLLDSGSMSLAMTGNNSTYTLAYPASSNSAGYTSSTTSSAGVNLTSLFTGFKLFEFNIGSTLSPGMYWFGLLATNSTSSVANCGFSFSFVGASMTNTAIAPLNAHTSNYTTGTGFSNQDGGGPWPYGFGAYSGSAAGQTAVPNVISLSGMTGSLTQFLWMKMWSTS